LIGNAFDQLSDSSPHARTGRPREGLQNPQYIPFRKQMKG
jgi:hypothetical protein